MLVLTLAQQRFLTIRNAYEILKDPIGRRVYDIYGMAGFEGCERCRLFRDYIVNQNGRLWAYYGTTGLMV